MSERLTRYEDIEADRRADLNTEIAHLRAENERLTRERDKWKSRENETQEALQSVGNRFGFLGGEPRTSAVERVLSELEARAEAAERQVATLREALEVFQSYGCPVCNGGDCASANPPVALCPMRMARDALAETEPKNG